MKQVHNDTPFVIERTFAAPLEKVWNAISNKDEMKKWYFDLPEFRAVVGFEFSFSGGPPDGELYLHRCRITEVIPNQKLSYSWRYDGYPGDSLVTFELFSNAKGTTLRLTHSGLNTFPANKAEFAKKSFEAGWNDIIGKSLKEFVES